MLYVKKDLKDGECHLIFYVLLKTVIVCSKWWDFFFFFFSIWVFFHEHSRLTGLQGKGEGIYLTPLYHFHPLVANHQATHPQDIFKIAKVIPIFKKESQVVSSAKWQVLEYFMHLPRSFMQIWKSRVPDTDPCGIPVDI